MVRARSWGQLSGPETRHYTDINAVSGDTTPAIDANGTTYFLSDAGTLYAVSIEAKLKWLYNLPGGTPKQPVIGPGKRVYVATETTLYAVGEAAE